MSAAGKFAIVPLDPALHDRAAFACGVFELDQYLQQQANQDVKRSVAAVFVAATEGDALIHGYYTLSQSSVHLDALSSAQQKKLPRYPDIPITLLGRLAVDTRAQRTGLGSLLLGDAVRRTLAVARDVGTSGIMVDAINESAIRFYVKFGFVNLPESSTRLFLPIATFKRAR